MNSGPIDYDPYNDNEEFTPEGYRIIEKKIREGASKFVGYNVIGEYPAPPDFN